MNKNIAKVNKDHIEGKGMVLIQVIDKATNKVVKRIENHNLIVKTGRAELIKLIAKKSSKGITKMAVGKGGTEDLEKNAFNPVPPVDSDKTLREQVYITDISSTEVDEKGTKPKVTFTALFDCSDVDSLVNEAGLIFEDGSTLFARYTFDTVSIRSSTNFSLQISWTIEI